jgi:hypothetical protein
MTKRIGASGGRSSMNGCSTLLPRMRRGTKSRSAALLVLVRMTALRPAAAQEEDEQRQHDGHEHPKDCGDDGAGV